LVPIPALHRRDLTLKCRNFRLRYGPGVRSQRRILPGNRLLQILYLLTQIGVFLVDISRHLAARWFGLSLQMSLSLQMILPGENNIYWRSATWPSPLSLADERGCLERQHPPPKGQHSDSNDS